MPNKYEAIQELIAEAERAATALDTVGYDHHATILRRTIANIRTAMVQPDEADVSAPPGTSITPYQWFAGMAMQGIIHQYAGIAWNSADIDAICSLSHLMAAAMVREPQGDEE